MAVAVLQPLPCSIDGNQGAGTFFYVPWIRCKMKFPADALWFGWGSGLIKDILAIFVEEKKGHPKKTRQSYIQYYDDKNVFSTIMHISKILFSYNRPPPGLISMGFHGKESSGWLDSSNHMAPSGCFQETALWDGRLTPSGRWSLGGLYVLTISTNNKTPMETNDFDSWNEKFL